MKETILALSLCLLASNGHTSNTSTPTTSPSIFKNCRNGVFVASSASCVCNSGFVSSPGQSDCSYQQKKRATALALHCLPPLMGLGQLYLENYLIGLTQMAFTSLSLYMVAGICRISDGEAMGFLGAQTFEKISGGLGPIWLLMIVGNLASLGWWIAQAVFIGGGTWTINGYVPYTDGNGVPLTGY